MSGVARRRRSAPWAGLAALVFVLLSDRWLAAEPRLWDWAVERIDEREAMELGVARDHAALSRLSGRTPDRPRVFVLGSSRAQRGFLERELEDAFAGRVELVKLAHAGLTPYEVAALTDELLDAQPAVVVLTLSEFDTHRPLRLMAQTAPGSLAVLGDLVAETSWGFLKTNRRTLLQLALAATLNAYRYRELTAAVGWRLGASFAEGPRRRAMQTVGPVLGVPRRPALPGDTSDSVVIGRTGDELDALVSRLGMTFPELSAAARRAELLQVLSISRGAHALLQQRLLSRSVERLTRAGVAVVILELPLHPLARQYYEVTLRDEALAFFAELAAAFAVEVITEEMSGPYLKDDFADLTHTAGDGAVKLSRSLARTVLSVLNARESSGPK